jgi:hypothetical protein
MFFLHSNKMGFTNDGYDDPIVSSLDDFGGFVSDN